ncbi:MAG: SDR family oxidoreductase [candidate division Zixibacteria bacterium]|nr:SDR family oxidoreductase [candidate division Zixibacteria bacterium]
MSHRLFEHRVALVTGGARGIGRAVCEMLARNGASVAVNYEKNEDEARKTLSLIKTVGADGMVVQADVSQPDAVERMVNEIRTRLGPVDLLVNNAGVAVSTDHTKVDFDQWKRMFAVNVDGPFLTTWAVKDEMIERGYGRIVNVASLAGVVLKKEMIPYATAKAAVISFTRHCAVAFAPHVRVNCVAPGLTDTDLARSSNPGAVEAIIALLPWAGWPTRPKSPP